MQMKKKKLTAKGLTSSSAKGLVSKLLMVIRWRDLLDEKMDTIGTRILMRMVLIMIIEKEGKKRFVFFFVCLL
jgi:hypothetical protein